MSHPTRAGRRGPVAGDESPRRPGPCRQAAAAAPDDPRPLRVLALVPGDPGGPLGELIGVHPLVSYARAAAGLVHYTVVTDEETAGRFTGLPLGAELIVVPLWRVLPRDEAVRRPALARLHTGLACLTAALGAPGGGLGGAAAPVAGLRAAGAGAAAPWAAVHGWGLAGALVAAAAARILGLPWAWSLPADLDESEATAGWALSQADLLVCEDPQQADAVRRRWAPEPERLAVLPCGALAGWEAEPGPAPAGADGGGVGLLFSAGAAANDVEAVLDALADVRSAGGAAPVGGSPDGGPARGGHVPGGGLPNDDRPGSRPLADLPIVLGIGSRCGEAAAAFRAGARRRGLVPGIGWRDLEPSSPLADPARALAGLRVLVWLGRETPSRRLLAALWRQGMAVVRVLAAAAAPGAAGALDTGAQAHRLAWACCPPLRPRLAAALTSRWGAGEALRRDCRAAWRDAVGAEPVAPDRLGRLLRQAYLDLPGAAGQRAAAGEAIVLNHGGR